MLYKQGVGSVYLPVLMVRTAVKSCVSKSASSASSISMPSASSVTTLAIFCDMLPSIFFVKANSKI